LGRHHCLDDDRLVLSCTVGRRDCRRIPGLVFVLHICRIDFPSERIGSDETLSQTLNLESGMIALGT
jgi:hypothetical protein